MVASSRQFIAQPSEPCFSSRDRLDDAVGVTTSQISHDGFAVGCYRGDRPDHGLSVPSPFLDLFMVVVTLRALSPVEQWQDGRSIGSFGCRVGSLAWFDFRRQWVTDLRYPFHTVNFFLPISVFEELGRELKQSGATQHGVPLRYFPQDATMLHIAKALIPLLARAEQASVLSSTICCLPS